MTTENSSLHLLVVEDNLTDVLLLKDALEDVPAVEFVLTHVRRLDDALTSLGARTFDAVLLDLGLPDSQGLETFTTMQSRHLSVPILVLSGLDDEKVAVRAVEEGAQDYLLKGKINSSMLLRTIRYAIARKQVEQRLVTSEDGHRRLFETARDGIFILDADSGQITAANPAVGQMLGYESSEVIGKRLWEIGPFRESGASRVAFSTLHERNDDRYQDLTLAAKDGRSIDVEFVSNVYPVRDRRVIQCNIRDIGARKRAEEERDRFFTISLDIMCIADPRGYFTRLNPAFAALVGFSDAELMSRPFIEFVHPEDVCTTIREVEKLATGAPSVAFENRYRCLDGSYKWLTWTAAPHNGSLYAAAHDITALKESEEALRQSRDDLELRVSSRTAELSLANQRLQSEIAERQRAEESLYKNHEFLEAVLE
ncbi:MAG: PAS domain S-box protein, partial [Chloroflexi bacterium]|nr:PAS domain S-box protein [Chloroflexota bacterium]